MRSFEHVSAPTISSAIAALRDGWQSRIIAGGTDLLTVMKAGVAQPKRLVDIKPVRELRYIRFDPDEGLRLGALATLEDVESNEVIQRSFRALHQAVVSAATPQLRNMGTVAGNLCQEPRCWYFRGPFRCWLKGGETCYAAIGDHRLHAVFGSDSCIAVQPSDLATALVAMDGRIRLVGPRGERGMSLQEFFTVPRERHRRLTVLRPDEIVQEVMVPALPDRSATVFLKAMDRGGWAFALTSVAVQVQWDEGQVRDARIVLGSVASVPWRARSAEKVVQGQALTREVVRKAAEAALEGGRPLEQTSYKLSLIRNLVARALTQLAEERAVAIA